MGRRQRTAWGGGKGQRGEEAKDSMGRRQRTAWGGGKGQHGEEAKDSMWRKDNRQNLGFSLCLGGMGVLGLGGGGRAGCLHYQQVGRYSCQWFLPPLPTAAVPWMSRTGQPSQCVTTVTFSAAEQTDP